MTTGPRAFADTHPPRASMHREGTVATVEDAGKRADLEVEGT